MRSGDALPPQKRRGRQRYSGGSGCQTRRGTDSAPDFGDHNMGHIPSVDTIVPRPADTGEPVGQCRALGNAHPLVPAYGRIPVAGGTYGTCHKGRGRGRSSQDAGRICRFCRERDGRARDKRVQDAYRTFRRSGGYLLYRSYDAGRQGPPGRYFTLFGTEFRQSVRCEIFGQGQQHELRMGYFMGGIDPPYGCAYNDAFGRQRAGTASCPGADRSCHGAYL